MTCLSIHGFVRVPISSTSEETYRTYIQAGRRIEYLTIAWTSLEAGIGIAAGLIAGSVALIGFGVDSIIELSMGIVLLWRLNDHPESEGREKIAHQLVGVGFFALAAYISFDALRTLLTHDPPRVSYFGIAYAGACLVVMPLIARAKRRIAHKIGSDALHADSHQSDICAYLSGILIVGLALNALFGWWWADPVAALCMIPIVLKEGYDGVRGKACCHHG